MTQVLAKFIETALPNGRAWKNPQSLTYLLAIASELEKVKAYVENNTELNNSFVNNYDSWRAVFNLPIATTDEQKAKNVSDKFTDRGGQSPTYVEQELNKIGFNVSVTANFNPTVDPSGYVFSPGGITLGSDDAYLNGDKAVLNGGNAGIQAEFVINYIDPSRDSIYKDSFLITDLSRRWQYAFFIHEKGGTRDDPVQISAARRLEFRQKIIELKNFGTWAIANVIYQ